jgi:hypothetical protein
LALFFVVLKASRKTAEEGTLDSVNTARAAEEKRKKEKSKSEVK